MKLYNMLIIKYTNYKKNVKYPTKMANSQQMARCTTCSEKINNADTTTSSTYRLDRHHQQRKMEDLSMAQNTNIERVDLFTTTTAGKEKVKDM